MLDGEGAIRADFTGRGLQVSTERFRYFVGSGNGAHGRATDTHDGSPSRLTIEHGVEFDDAIYVCERHAERVADLGHDRLGQPAVDSLGGVQRRQERRAALRRQAGEDRAQRTEFGISHRVFQTWDAASLPCLLVLSERDEAWKSLGSTAPDDNQGSALCKPPLEKLKV